DAKAAHQSLPQDQQGDAEQHRHEDAPRPAAAEGAGRHLHVHRPGRQPEHQAKDQRDGTAHARTPIRRFASRSTSPTARIRIPASMALAKSAAQVISGSPYWLPRSILAPKPSTAPVGSSPTMVPTSAAATATFSEAKK